MKFESSLNSLVLEGIEELDMYFREFAERSRIGWKAKRARRRAIGSGLVSDSENLPYYERGKQTRLESRLPSALLHTFSLPGNPRTSIWQGAGNSRRWYRGNALVFNQVHQKRICLWLHRHLKSSKFLYSIYLLRSVVMLIVSWHEFNRNARCCYIVWIEFSICYINVK